MDGDGAQGGQGAGDAGTGFGNGRVVDGDTFGDLAPAYFETLAGDNRQQIAIEVTDDVIGDFRSRQPLLDDGVGNVG